MPLRKLALILLFGWIHTSDAMNWGPLGKCFLFLSGKSETPAKDPITGEPRLKWKAASEALSQIGSNLSSSDPTVRKIGLDQLAALHIDESSVGRKNYRESLGQFKDILLPLSKKYLEDPTAPDSIAGISALTAFYKNNTKVLSLGGELANDYYYNYRLPDEFREAVTASMNHSRNNAKFGSLPHVTREEWIRKEGLSFLGGIGKKELPHDHDITAVNIQRLFPETDDVTKKRYFDQLTGRAPFEASDRNAYIDAAPKDAIFKITALLDTLGYTSSHEMGADTYTHPTDGNTIVFYRKNYTESGNLTDENLAKVIRSIKERTDAVAKGI